MYYKDDRKLKMLQTKMFCYKISRNVSDVVQN